MWSPRVSSQPLLPHDLDTLGCFPTLGGVLQAGGVGGVAALCTSAPAVAQARLQRACPAAALVFSLLEVLFSPFFRFFWPKLKAEASGHLQGRTWGWAGVTVRGQLCRKVLGPAGYPGAPRAPQARLEGSGLETGLEQPNCRKFCAGSGPNGPSRVLGSCFSGCHLRSPPTVMGMPLPFWGLTPILWRGGLCHRIPHLDRGSSLVSWWFC